MLNNRDCFIHLLGKLIVLGRQKFFLVSFIFLITFSSFSYADAGLPMIVIFMPSLLILLIPIILIEAVILLRYLKITFLKSLVCSSVGNVISTLIGIPLSWIALVIIQMITGGGRCYNMESTWGKIISITWQSSWLCPNEGQFYWMIPLAMAFLMIPFFFVSWMIEGYFVKYYMPNHLKPKAYTGSLYANLASYLFLEWLIFLYLIKNLMS